MAGFSVNLKLVLNYPLAQFSQNIGSGMQESYFLSSLVSEEDLEPKADNCTKVNLHYIFLKKIKSNIV
jgi:hypothetical protein